MDKNNFERLRTEIQMLLTEYEEKRTDAKAESLELRKCAKIIDCGNFLYKNLVRIVNDSESWEVE